MSPQYIIAQYLPWLLSALGIVAAVYTGNRNYNGWVLSLLAQAGWGVWIAATGNFGFMPLTAALTFVYARNLYKWWRDAQQAEAQADAPTVAKLLAQELELPEVPRRFYHIDGDHV